MPVFDSFLSSKSTAHHYKVSYYYNFHVANFLYLIQGNSNLYLNVVYQEEYGLEFTAL